MKVGDLERGVSDGAEGEKEKLVMLSAVSPWNSPPFAGISIALAKHL